MSDANISQLAVEPGDSRLGQLLMMPCGNETRSGQLPVSTMVYIMLLLALTAGNVVSNLFGALMVARCLSRSFISGLLLVLSAAEILFNASQFAYQLMVWQFGYLQRPFASLAQGRAIGYAFWAMLQLSLTFLMLRNWVIVLISCVRFERVYYPFGPVRYTTPRRLACLLACLLTVCLASGLPKALRYNPVICTDSLTLSQAPTWLFDSPTRATILTLQSYLVSTLAPILLVVLLNALILRAVNRQRRLFNRRHGAADTGAASGGGGGGRSALSRSKVTDRLLLLLILVFVVCELPAFVSGLLHKWLPAGTSAHLIHVAHLATALDSALNVLVYIMSQRQSGGKCVEVCVPSERQRLRQRQRQHQLEDQPQPSPKTAAAAAAAAATTGAAAAATTPNGEPGNLLPADADVSLARQTNLPTAAEACRLTLLLSPEGAWGLQDQPLTQVTSDGVLESTF